MECCRCSSKLFICIIGLILWAVAGILGGVAVWVFMDNKFLVISDTHFVVPAIVLMAVAVVIFLLGICGCVGAVKESRIILSCFSFFMFVILMGYVIAAGLGLAFRGDVRDSVQGYLLADLDNYGNNSKSTQLIDELQAQIVQCCGVRNHTDWWTTPYFESHNRTYPESCCQNETSCNATQFETDLIYTEGCLNKIVDYLHEYLALVISVSIIFAIILVLALTAACVLMCRPRTFAYLDLQETPSEGGGGYHV